MKVILPYGIVCFFIFSIAPFANAHTINPKVIEKITGVSIEYHTHTHDDTDGDPRTFSRRLYTIPEWYIVYHAQEYGTLVTNGGRPSQFPFFTAIKQTWNSWEKASLHANEDPDPTTNTILWTIAMSSSIENGVIGLYEKTIGFTTELLHFRYKTAEDKFIDSTAHAYGQWLVHTPWYEFSYGDSLRGLWSTWSWTSFTPRGLERRVSFTVGYSIKLLYAQVIRFASQSQFGGATLATEFTVSDISLEQVTESVGVTEAEAHDANIVHALAPRYRAFLPTVYDLISQGAVFTTIQRHEIITASVVSMDECEGLSPWFLFTFPTLDRTASERYFYDVPAAELTNFINTTSDCSLTIEHLYDF